MSRQDPVERPTEKSSVSERVISAVASTTRTDPMDLEPLYEVIAPDALEALHGGNGFGRSRSPVRIEFTYADCDVVVSEDGSVTVTERAVEGS